ncbi:metallophosphoesterase family protein [Acidicapsa dinghuensis]|uniref:Metallophosphoesterase family protein n=1 Tax=Acidicapsa dinghuensis TaxID=2218256 RepID=A0ABW1EGV4_9BACT|nr:metallophosphoesterase [Acidicapsa dinghuensis]
MKMTQDRFRVALLMGAAASVLAFAAGASAQNQNSNGNPWPYNKVQRSPVLAAVGDVACQPGTEPSGEKAGENCSGDTAQNLNQSQAATAQQIENMQPDLVAILGDEQYQVGNYSDFENSFDLTYGAFKFIQRPAPGNHEFYNEHGAIGVAGYGYFSYYNGFQHNADGSMMTTTVSNSLNGTSPTPQPVPRADGQAGHFEEVNNGLNGDGVGDGWYSYNLGSWHLISLNIECETQPGGCSTTGSWFASELAWLKKDLEANHSQCTLAYWHQPTFSAANSIAVPEGPTAVAFWDLLYQYGADLVLNGHDHLYARYRPLDPNGNSDPRKGIREFIIGTGGETLDTVVTTGTSSDPGGHANFNAENLEASTGEFWGVMKLTLNPNGYAWDYESALKDPAQTTGPSKYSDKGVAACHGPSNRW